MGDQLTRPPQTDRLVLAFWNGEGKTESSFCVVGHPREQVLLPMV